jgi:hypothetical protein
LDVRVIDHVRSAAAFTIPMSGSLGDPRHACCGGLRGGTTTAATTATTATRIAISADKNTTATTCFLLVAIPLQNSQVVQLLLRFLQRGK